MRSLRRRLVVGTGLGLVLVFAAAGLVIEVLARGALVDQFDAALAARARALAVLVEQEGDEVETDLDERFLPDLADGGAPWIELVVDGEVHFRSARPRPGPRGHRAYVHSFAPRREDGDPAPPRAAVLTVVQSTASLEASLAQVRTALGLAGLVALALGLAVLAWIAGHGVAPLRRLADELGAVDADDLSVRFDDAAAPAELAPVVARLNELLARVEEAFARERALTAEIAHELRTPLAGITATLEVALDRERTPARYQAAIREVLAIAAQTRRMIEALLALARLDAGAAAPARDTVDVSALVAAAVADASRAAAARDLHVTTAIAPGGHAVTDASLIAIAVANLLDNAVAHADAGGTVEVGLEVSAAALVLTIANTGSQVAAADAARTVQRFWRGDAARQVGAHAGLGLALCQKIVDLVGAQLAIHTERGGWFRVVLTLAAAAPLDAPPGPGVVAGRES